MKVTVVGTGYVGLVAAAGFAETGNIVYAIDVNQQKIEQLKQGQVPFFEPGLDELVLKNYNAGRLLFQTDLESAITNSSVAFVAVGTPPQEDGSADLSAVKQVIKNIAEIVDKDFTIVIKSTVPVGTNTVMQELASAVSTYKIELASNPEFLKEGAAVDDFFKPDRVIVGVRSKQSEDIFKELYAPFTRRSERLIVMSPESAEMAKYASNCLLATRITLMNEFANLCEKVGADIFSVRRGVGADKRIGTAFLFPGVGYGGSCFPKDVTAMVHQGQMVDASMKILTSVDQVNNAQKQILVKKIKAHFGNELTNKKFALWGLSFKPNTDDIREAPALVTIDALLAAGAQIIVHDPEAMDNVQAIYGDKIQYSHHTYEMCKDAAALVIHTEWNEYRTPDFNELAQQLREKIIFDGRNLYDPRKLDGLGFVYFPVGRPLQAIID